MQNICGIPTVPNRCGCFSWSEGVVTVMNNTVIQLKPWYGHSRSRKPCKYRGTLFYCIETVFVILSDHVTFFSVSHNFSGSDIVGCVVLKCSRFCSKSFTLGYIMCEVTKWKFVTAVIFYFWISVLQIFCEIQKFACLIKPTLTYIYVYVNKIK